MVTRTVKELTFRLSIMADEGNDEKAQRLLTRLLYAILLMRPRDLWTWLYDWIQEASKLLDSRKIPIMVSH